MDDYSTLEILDMGISCLLEKLGTVGTEQFISTVMREQFDYTKWRRQNLDDSDPAAFNEAAVRYARSHPFVPTKE